MSRKESVVDRIKVPLDKEVCKSLKPFQKKTTTRSNQSGAGSEPDQSENSSQNTQDEEKSLDEKMLDSDREDSLDTEKSTVTEKVVKDNEMESEKSLSVGGDSVPIGSDSVFTGGESLSIGGDSLEQSGKDLREVTIELKDDIEKALDDGEKLEKKLDKQDKSVKSICRQVTENYGRYSPENMDDLFDSSGESDSEVAVGEPESQTKRTEDKTPEKVQNENENKQDITTTDKYRIVTNNPDFENLDSKIAELKNEAYHRHLKGITEDILTCIEKLKVLFVIAFEQLDSAEGKDQCNLIVEDFFFRPLWKHLLMLFR